MADIAASPNSALTSRQRAMRNIVNAGSLFWLGAQLYCLWLQSHVTTYTQASQAGRRLAMLNIIAIFWFVAATFWNRRFETRSAPPTQAKITRMRFVLIPASVALIAFGVLLVRSSLR